jgi:hypothetical protein
MAITYYRAECTDGVNSLRLCSHAHATLVSAVACISSAGEYIVAQEDGVFRALTDVEQVEYKHAIYGGAIDRGIASIEGYRKKRFA